MKPTVNYWPAKDGTVTICITLRKCAPKIRRAKNGKVVFNLAEYIKYLPFLMEVEPGYAIQPRVLLKVTMKDNSRQAERWIEEYELRRRKNQETSKKPAK